MPIFFQQDIDEVTKLGIWKIEEEESFFLKQVPLQREITHPHKRLQHLAGRYLLKYLFNDFPVELIQIADTRKPFLENEAYHFSISHCGDFAAVIASRQNRVGIDIEIISSKIEKIKHKFVSEVEKSIMNGQSLSSISDSQPINLLTLLWSCKEAAFKWYGLGGVDFKDHMVTKQIITLDKKSFETIMLFKKNEELYLNLQSCFFDELCMSFVIT
jgi:phosphopantetheinyl transferase